MLARWTNALQRAKRPAGRRWRAAGADAPYPGLARFEREDARWFFGREDVTDLMAELTDEAWPTALANAPWAACQDRPPCVGGAFR